MSTKHRSRKEKTQISKLIELSDEEKEDSEHELSHYVNDRVKLMKEVLKIIKPRKVKSMAPECIRDLDIEEINSMLLEELLGISNKRLKYIFNGQNPAEDSSSTNSDEDKLDPALDVISLDDVSEDDFVINLDSDTDAAKRKKPKKAKKRAIDVPKPKKVKKEKPDRARKRAADEEKLQEENLMSVLELLELQARARAIRSQLMIEGSKRTAEEAKVKAEGASESDDEAVIIESPKNEEIVITSSSSSGSSDENDGDNAEKPEIVGENGPKGGEPKQKRIKLNRERFNQLEGDKQSSEEIIAEMLAKKSAKNDDGTENSDKSKEEGEINDDEEEKSEDVTKNDGKDVIEEAGKSGIVIQDNILIKSNKTEVNSQDLSKNEREDDGDDGIIIIVDQDEIDDIIGVD